MKVTRPSIRWRFFVTPAADGPYNMALDEALMRRAALTGTATFRRSRWEETSGRAMRTTKPSPRSLACALCAGQPAAARCCITGRSRIARHCHRPTRTRPARPTTSLMACCWRDSPAWASTPDLRSPPARFRPVCAPASTFPRITRSPWMAESSWEAPNGVTAERFSSTARS